VLPGIVLTIPVGVLEIDPGGSAALDHRSIVRAHATRPRARYRLPTRRYARGTGHDVRVRSSIDAIESLARRVRTDSMTGTERFNHVKAPVAGAG
jgi:hypothetical protein